jgi:hypothetical protein
MDFTQTTASTPPAAPKRCPIIDLVELIFTFLAASPRAALMVG